MDIVKIYFLDILKEKKGVSRKITQNNTRVLSIYIVPIWKQIALQGMILFSCCLSGYAMSLRLRCPCQV